jgi:hypothetical protein
MAFVMTDVQWYRFAGACVAGLPVTSNLIVNSNSVAELIAPCDGITGEVSGRFSMTTGIVAGPGAAIGSSQDAIVRVRGYLVSNQ